MPTKKQQIGNAGEEIALNYLLNKGDTLITRNYRTEHGEVDLITKRNHRTVFVEVKTRTSDNYGPPEESVTARKQEALIACSEAFFDAHPLHTGDWQIDVIAIRMFSNAEPQITHFENAVYG